MQEYYVTVSTLMYKYNLISQNLWDLNEIFIEESLNKKNPITEERRKFLLKTINHHEDKQEKVEELFDNIEILINEEETKILFGDNIEYAVGLERKEDLV